MADLQVNPEDIIRERGGQVLRQMRNMGGPLLVGLLLVGMAATSFYTIRPEEVGVVTRFGKYVRETEPGLHFKLPLFIERVQPVAVRRTFIQEFGYRASTTRRRRTTSRTSVQSESLMLTGDLNVLDVAWMVQFQISDPRKFLYEVENQEEAIRDISEAVMRQLVGDYSVDEVLTTKRAEIDDIAKQNLQSILDSYNLGVEIITVKLQDVTPSDAVKPAFNEVNEAKQEKERVINQAWEAYNRVVPQALGQAAKMISEAEGYALDVINRAKGEAERFNVTWEAYRQSPEVTRRRLYLDALAEVLPVVKDKYIVDPSQQSILPILQLGGSKGGE